MTPEQRLQALREELAFTHDSERTLDVVAVWLARSHEDGRPLWDQRGWASRYASYLLRTGDVQRPVEDDQPSRLSAASIAAIKASLQESIRAVANARHDYAPVHDYQAALDELIRASS